MLKFFDERFLTTEVSQQITQLASELEKTHVADDRARLAKQLLDIAIEHEPNIDRRQAQNTIMRFVTNPDLLLFVAGATTLFGNISYVNQYAQSASQSKTASDKALNLIHAAIFGSFTLEKMVDIGKSTLASTAAISRREALMHTASFMKYNYPLMAGGWLTFNQVASGAAFGTQAIATESSKEAVTAGMRAMASFASIGMTLYKYHSTLETEKKSGKKLIDDRVRRAIEPIDKVLGPAIDRMGGAFPYMAAAMLTGPHFSILYNKLTDKEHPQVSTASILTIIGYSSFVAYLASRNDGDKKEPQIQKDVEKQIAHSVEMCDGFSRLTSALAKKAAEGMIDQSNLSALIHKHLPVGERAASHIARATLSVGKHAALSGLVETLASEYAIMHVGQIGHAARDSLDPQTQELLRGQMKDMLRASIQSQQSQLENQSYETEAPKLNRRQFLTGGR